MHSSNILALFASVLAVSTAAPSPARVLKARTQPAVDVLVQSSALTSTNLNAHAIQVILGEVKVCLGDNGFPPCQLSKLSISPFGNTTAITGVECQGFSDENGDYPVTSVFTSAYPAVLSQTGTVTVGSVVCEYIY